MQDAVSRIMEQQREARASMSAATLAELERRRNRQRLLGVAAILSVIVFGASLAVAIPKWRQPIPPPTPEAAEAGARRVLVFAAQVVEGRRAQTGRLPASLAEVGLHLPGVGYRLVGDGFELNAQAAGAEIVLRSGEDRDAFLRGR
jgi:hypothetical protein